MDNEGSATDGEETMCSSWIDWRFRPYGSSAVFGMHRVPVNTAVTEGIQPVCRGGSDVLSGIEQNGIAPRINGLTAPLEFQANADSPALAFVYQWTLPVVAQYIIAIGALVPAARFAARTLRGTSVYARIMPTQAFTSRHWWTIAHKDAV